MSFKKIDCNLTQKFSEYPDFGVLNGVKVFVSGTAIAGPFAGCLRDDQLVAEPPQRVLYHVQPAHARRQEDLQKVPRVGRYLDRVQQGRHLCQDGPHR